MTTAHFRRRSIFRGCGLPRDGMRKDSRLPLIESGPRVTRRDCEQIRERETAIRAAPPKSFGLNGLTFPLGEQNAKSRQNASAARRRHGGCPDSCTPSSTTTQCIAREARPPRSIPAAGPARSRPGSTPCRKLLKYSFIHKLRRRAGPQLRLDRLKQQNHLISSPLRSAFSSRQIERFGHHIAIAREASPS